jgi:hypothetical protein
VNPKSTKKSALNRLDVQTEDGLWRQIIGKTQVEEHLIERNVEQFSHAGATPLGYTELGRELGHTGDTPMAEAILDGTFEHESLTDEALASILQQLRKHPNMQEIIQLSSQKQTSSQHLSVCPRRRLPLSLVVEYISTRHVLRARKTDSQISSRQFMPP